MSHSTQGLEVAPLSRVPAAFNVTARGTQPPKLPERCLVHSFTAEQKELQLSRASFQGTVAC
jgi:hypothetical protein